MAARRGGREEVNLNTASAEELDRIYGIDPSTARKILEYGKERGRSACAVDLTNIDGIDGEFVGISWSTPASTDSPDGLPKARPAPPRS